MEVATRGPARLLGLLHNTGKIKPDGLGLSASRHSLSAFHPRFPYIGEKRKAESRLVPILESSGKQRKANEGMRGSWAPHAIAVEVDSLPFQRSIGVVLVRECCPRWLSVFLSVLESSGKLAFRKPARVQEVLSDCFPSPRQYALCRFPRFFEDIHID